MPIDVVKQTFLHGPNLYSDSSALRLELRCGDDERATLALAPPEGLGGLAGCEALAGGREVVELVEAARGDLGEGADGWALALAIAGRLLENYVFAPARGRVLPSDPETVVLLIPGDLPRVAHAALTLGLALVLGLQRQIVEAGRRYLIEGRQKFIDLARGASPEMLTMAVARRALEDGIPVYIPAPNLSLVQLGQGRHGRLAAETILDPQSTQAMRLARDKWATLARLRTMGLPSLPSHVVRDADRAVAAARAIGAAVAVKPASGGKGVGISLRLTEEADIRQAFATAAKSGRNVLIERYAPGRDYRLLVVGGRLLAAAERLPAIVTGDGRLTVRQLVARLNTDPRRGPPFERLLDRVKFDERTPGLLARQGQAIDSVPGAGVEVVVTSTSNFSQGGTTLDVTDAVHPDNREAAEVAARSVRALVAGVDFITPDIGRSWREGEGFILEVNTSPCLRPHWAANPAQDVVTPVLRVAFAEGDTGRIPTAGITGSLGKTTTCQMLAHIARGAGRHPALNTSQGTWSGAARLKVGDYASGRHTVDLLGDAAVDFAVAELARGGLLKYGMGLDWLDAAAVLNVSDNHVGIDGIASREELARIKAIPVRRARRWVFLNADEPLVLAMREAMVPGARLGLVSPDPASPALAEHRAAGGCTVTIEGKGRAAAIVVRQGEAVEFELKLAAIPAHGGDASRAIAENAMFAAAMALKMGLTAAEVTAALATFASDQQQNPGRHNRIEGLPFDLLVTWFDGLPAFDELLRRAERTEGQGKRHIYLVVAADRSDAWIEATAKKAAGHFDHYWCSEMEDTRGRAPGEVAELTARYLREAGVDQAAITCLVGEQRAVGPVLAQVEPGGQMTMLVYDTAEVLADIAAFRDSLAPA